MTQKSAAYEVKVVPYDPNWVQLFDQEAKRLSTILGDEIIAIHHIGSTAIPGIYAKPILDFLIEVRNIGIINQFNEPLAQCGYEAKGEFGLPGRRFFSKGAGSERTHHVHIFQANNPEYERHLAFRDYLLSHPDVACQYSRLKQELAERFPRDSVGYTSAKDDFIRAIEQKARTWRKIHLRQLVMS
ncbi:GrpB family protein [Anaerolineales bacterium HSG6]|nr:GrpB family protein [Anaerolineales bacterium HSG6]MDM8529636.1 GrpB family protein [Anaerolineales bacterium HSG25]